MTWSAYLYDTMTGLLGAQIDIPSFSWSMTVSDSGFTTTDGKNPGEDDMQSMQLPWSAVPGDTPRERAQALQPWKRGIALFWRTPSDIEHGSMGTPILAGALGVRTSSHDSVSLPFISMLGLLGDRYLVHEHGFGSGPGHTSQGSYQWSNLSYRALACEVIRACTETKPGGRLPIDLPYLGEHGTHSLPADGQSDTTASTQKTTKRVATPDGYVETTIDGDTTTVIERHDNKTTKKVNETRDYTVHTKKGDVTRQHTIQRDIPTGRTVTTVKTVTVDHDDYTIKTVTTGKTTYTYTTAGVQSGTTTTTDGPHETRLPRQSHTTYHDFNIASHRCSDIIKKITNADGGPDIQLRPYLSDSQHIRFRLEAGSDGDTYLHQHDRLALDCSPNGGTLENITIDRSAPYMRIYATGSGTDKATLCALAEDLTLVRQTDGWPLRETATSDSDLKEWSLLQSTANATLNVNKHPLAQFTGELDADDTDASGTPLHPLGSFWPGETFDVNIQGWPDWPDGVTVMRLMMISGDNTGKVKLKFDPIPDPFA